jgi:hypothetical protein
MLNRLTVWPESLWSSFVKSQWVVFSSSNSSRVEVFQKVAKPLEAPLVLTALPAPFFQKVLLAWRVSDSSIFVSWIRRTSGFDIRTRSLIASSFGLLPSPLQFQETYCIKNLGGGGGGGGGSIRSLACLLCGSGRHHVWDGFLGPYCNIPV